LRGTLAAIPNKSNRLNRYPFDEQRYKDYDVIELCMDRIKNFRANATRYHKSTRNFLAGRLCLRSAHLADQSSSDPNMALP
jgi:hypothetical protein